MLSGDLRGAGHLTRSGALAAIFSFERHDR